MSRRKTDNSTQQRIVCLGAYYLTIGFFLIAMMAPEGRVWGINWWAYLSVSWWVALALLGLSAGPVLWLLAARIHRNETGEHDSGTNSTYLKLALPFGFVFAALYLFFPSQTHFLGDGYQLLSRLADGLGSVKSWDVGASLLNDAVFSATSGSNTERALTTYRIISVVSGVMTLGILFVGATLLFKSTVRRILFMLGVATGGYALMFFGYVENYALLIALLTLYSLIGLLALRDRVSVWWTLPLVAAATFIHIFGLTLLPSLGYLLLRRTRVGEGFAALRPKTKLLIGLTTFISGLAAYHYLCSNFYFFTFAFLPIIPDQFTVEGDSLLSVKHLLDTLNLLFLLVPGLLVLVSGLLMTGGKAVFESIESRFLLILTLSTLAAVYVFNPGIGMPRNWDLFSIVGIPLAMLCFHTLLSLKARSMTPLLAALLACTLAGLVLAPRVLSQAQPEVAIAHFKDYLELDKIRNRNARRLLIDYYRQTGDTAAASREQTLAERDFPESAHNKRGKQHLRSGNIDRAEVEFRGAIELNPLFYDAYANLANCSITRGDLDSALVLLKIADGLNPYNASTISNIGTVLMRMNDLENALDAFHESLRIDSLNKNAMVGLASSYLKSGQPDRSVEYVTKLHERTKMTYHYFQQATEAYLEAGFHDQARVAYRCAVDRGLSAEEIETMITRYPQLAN